MVLNITQAVNEPFLIFLHSSKKSTHFILGKKNIKSGVIRTVRVIIGFDCEILFSVE